MTLTQLRAMTRALVPGLKSDVVSDTLLDQLLNSGARDIASFGEVFPGNKKFNAVADKGTPSNPHVLSVDIGDFLSEGAGLYWNQGTTAVPKWKYLYPRTIQWMEENKPNWKEIDSGSPKDYIIEGDNLYISPAPESSLTNGFWMFYGKDTVDMTSGSHYPFTGSTTKISRLMPFSFAICYYARWKIIPMLGKDTMNDDFSRNQNLYIKEREEKVKVWSRRTDMANSDEVGFRGPRIC